MGKPYKKAIFHFVIRHLCLHDAFHTCSLAIFSECPVSWFSSFFSYCFLSVSPCQNPLPNPTLEMLVLCIPLVSLYTFSWAHLFLLIVLPRLYQQHPNVFSSTLVLTVIWNPTSNFLYHHLNLPPAHQTPYAQKSEGNIFFLPQSS